METNKYELTLVDLAGTPIMNTGDMELPKTVNNKEEVAAAFLESNEDGSKNLNIIVSLELLKNKSSFVLADLIDNVMGEILTNVEINVNYAYMNIVLDDGIVQFILPNDEADVKSYIIAGMIEYIKVLDHYGELIKNTTEWLSYMDNETIGDIRKTIDLFMNNVTELK